MDWVEEFFVAPMREPNAYAPYNWANTLTYAVIGLAAAVVLYWILKKKGVKIDESLFKTALPFIVLGSALRAIQDAGVLPRQVELFGYSFYPFITPGIYVLVFAILAASFIIFRKELLKAQLLGWALALTAIATLFPLYSNWLHAAGAFGIAVLVVRAFKFAWLKRGLKATLLQAAVVFGQTLDGAASFLGIQFPPAGTSYFEQHVVAGGIMGAVSPFGFLAVKIAFALIVIELLRNDHDKEASNYALMLIAIFGLAPGLRGLLRVLAGV